jgi:hypothetical protein
MSRKIVNMAVNMLEKQENLAVKYKGMYNIL